MPSSNGRPEPEVIMNFGDGCSYSKRKLEEAYRPGGILEKHPTKNAKETHNVKREDVELIVHELEIPRAHAEKALVEHAGDVTKTLLALIASQP